MRTRLHATLPLLLALAPIVVRHDRSEDRSRALAADLGATVEVLPDGTGTLIAPRWVLTAAHVARTLSPFGPRVRIGGEVHRVRQALFHPRSEGDGFSPPEVDLALLELEEPVEGVAPVALFAGSDEAGRAVRVAGYGDWGAAGGRLAPGGGVLRAATNTVSEARAEHLLLRFDAPPDATELEGVGGPGDSGGPLFLDTDEGLRLAGVSSGSTGEVGAYGTTDVYVRASAFADWVDEARAAAEGAEPARPDVREVADGWPEAARGELVEAWLAAYAGGEEALRSFGASRRSPDNARRNPLDAFVRETAALAAETGPLTAVRVAPLGPRRWAVLARSRDGGWLGLRFWFDEVDGRVLLEELGLGPEEPPR